MNDQQLFTALRALDRPVVPEPDFADALFDQLRRQAFPAARQPLQRNMLLAAALMAAAALGLALVAGSRLLDRPVVMASPQPATSATPAPTPTPDYVVEVPPGVTPDSAPAAVADVVRSLEVGRFGLTSPIQQVHLVSWQFADAEYPTPDGGAMSSNAPFWAVRATTAAGEMLFLVSDGALEIVGTDGPRGDPTPEPTLQVLPTRDPSVPLRLLGPGGLAIEPVVLPIPGAADRPSVGPLVVAGDVLWALWTPIYTDGPMRLVRVDTATNDIATVALPDDLRFGTLAPGIERVWLSTESELIGLDPATGSVVDRFPVEGSVTGETAEGVWLRTVTNGDPAVGGAILVDPATGSELRRIVSPEGPGQAYVGLWQPPAFGSLWDVDRNTGLLHRIDPAGGGSTATIELGLDLAASCGSDFGPVGEVPGFDGAVGGVCSSGLVLVDPDTNAVVGTLPGRGTAVGSSWWSIRIPDASGPAWSEPGALVRTDPTGAAGELVLTLDRERAGGHLLVAAGDALWFLVAERGDENQDYEHNAALLRIAIDDLPT